MSKLMNKVVLGPIVAGLLIAGFIFTPVSIRQSYVAHAQLVLGLQHLIESAIKNCNKCETVPHVNYIDSKGHVHELVYFREETEREASWRDNDLTKLAGSSSIAVGPLAGYSGTDISQHVNYIDNIGHVHELYGRVGVNLKDNDLTALAGSSGVASTPAVQGSPLDGFWDTSSRQHVNFIDSQGHVRELYNTPTIRWKNNDLTKLAGSSSTAVQGAPGIWSPLVGYWDPSLRQHVNYIDKNGHVHELYNTSSGGWKDNDLTKLAGSSSIAVVRVGGLDGNSDSLTRQHVNFIAGGHVHELYNTPTIRWKDNDLTTLAGSSSGPGIWSPLAGYSNVVNSIPHVNYIDKNGHVHQLYSPSTGGWKDNDLTKLAGSSSTAVQESPLAAYALEDQHVNYIDSKGHVHELLLSPKTSWKDNDLTELAGSNSTAKLSSLNAYMSNTFVK